MSDTDTKKESTRTVPTDVQNPAVGAGTPPQKVPEMGILSFAKFAQTLAFKNMMSAGFVEDGRWSMHDYLTAVMSKFYHTLYYVPNLKDNKVIVVKPETLFIQTPSCNIIYPNMKNTIGYSRSFKQEPTRLLQMSDPISRWGGSNNTNPMCLYALVHIEDNILAYTKHNMPIYKNFIQSNGEGDLTAKYHPLNCLTRHESRNGIRTSVVNNGADLYLYMMSEHGAGAANQPTISIDKLSSEEQKGIDATLIKLARYELCRQRYMMRNGSVDMYFNPYIVPGFPMINVEPSKDAMNIYGYVTNVVHNLTERSWTTTVSFTAAHTDDEQPPGAFPIIESEYTDKLPETYTDMLGDSVVPVGNEELPEVINAYNQENTYITQSYRKVWRETPTLASYLEMIADGATVVQDNEFMVLQNNPNAQFFDPVLQERLKEYSRDILAGRAFALEDVN